jgi:SAM-dependent methyltransferase
VGGKSPDVDANRVYALGSSPSESNRLERQAEELAADSNTLLDRTGLTERQSAIDLGCGPRGVIDLLAARVGQDGTVIGVDADPSHVAMASAFIESKRLVCANAIVADARATGIAAESFDVVHCRTLLVNVPTPMDVVSEMFRLAKPGGWIVAMEPDSEYSMCYPTNSAYDRICTLFPVVSARNGADPTIGRRVPELFRRAELQNVVVEARVHAYPHGHSRRTVRLDLVRAMRAQIIEMGLASQAELDSLDAEARAHLGDPDTVVISGHMFLTSGRKPPVSHD